VNAWILGGFAANVMIVWMAAAWIFARRFNNAGWVDVAWAYAFLPVAALCLWLGEAPLWRLVVLAALVGIWSLRLGTYLAIRVGRHARSEDPRYAALREMFPKRPWLMFFAFFQVQGVLVAVLSIPFFAAAFHTAPSPGPVEMIGVLVWLTGIAGESLADSQLAAFRRNPANAGRVCDTGLWKYSRHPNYFFEWVVWLGFAIFALPAPGGWAGLLAPAIMYLLLTKVTGIPPAEARSLATKGDAFRDYAARTNAFFPGLPRGA